MNQRVALTPFGAAATGSVLVPGSKSHTNRALLCAALAEGTSKLSGVLFADDTEAMLEAVRSLGAEVVEHRSELILQVTGLGGRLRFNGSVINSRSSGTTSRFILPVLAAGRGPATLDGSEQLRSRPFAEQISALRALGCDLRETRAPGELPLDIVADELAGGEIEIAADSGSQFVSGLLLAAPLYSKGLTIHLSGKPVSRPYIEMTVKVMEDFGVNVEQPNESTYVVHSGKYRATDVDIEPDATAASYFFGAAAITHGRVRVEGLHKQSIQGDIQFVDVLQQLGAKVTWGDAFIEVEGDRIRGGSFDLRDFSDTVQTLAAVAAFADSEIEIKGVGFIRAKETDRLAAMTSELAKCGVDITETANGLVIRPDKWLLRGGVIETYDDHRMAMSMSLIGLRVPGIEILNPDCVKKTFPDFFPCLEHLRPRPQQRSKVVAVVAIDGPAGSGKSTVARRLAADLNLPHFDTGAMYRAVGVAALRAGVDVEDADGITKLATEAEIEISDRVFIDGVDVTEEIRTQEANQLVSVVAANAEVRRVLVPRQREWATGLGGGVMEGRDIGTEVFPDALLKVFLTADLSVRAERRFAESSGLTLGHVSEDLKRRDEVDSTREDSPLLVAPGAVIFDTSGLSVDDVVSQIATMFRALVDD
ncbi:MAG: cytidylate kinase [Acidimicrobiaceae bacterium]|jgi:3-phosphoshikimate 1-carboxyvinyltransferase|nr:cytidylate kinase [Acidimicrobiaceae bacterium]|tara:strand:+ start:737 stop:2683 length:1947 start_codon:yes stop_codon:yes gene_type:complete